MSRPIGFQSGDVDKRGGSSFASSMLFDLANQEVTVVGGTYSNYFQSGEEPQDSVLVPDCFVAILQLKDSSKPSWVRRGQYGNPSASEFCSDIAEGKEGRTLVLGHSDEHGILSHLLPHGDSRRSVYGMILDLDETISLDGGTLLHSSEVQYPMAITTDTTGAEIYVAEVFSEQTPNPMRREGGMGGSFQSGGMDLSAVGYSTLRSGLNFSARLAKLTTLDKGVSANDQSSGIDQTLHSEWSREYGTVGLSNVQVSALQYASPEALIMTGYTGGSGGVFGIPGGTSFDTIDSFIAVFSPSTGQSVNSMRIESNVPGDDKVLGMCMGKNNELFLVGMTSGVFDARYLVDSFSQHGTYAFILKLNLEDLSIVWGRQIGGSIEPAIENATFPHVDGFACAVTPDGQEIYVAGNVEDGATLILPDKQDFESAGGTDIFVAKFRTEDGRLDYALQTGTKGKDTVATGKSLSLDESGNLILLGNTNGEMYREKKDQTTSDMFLMSFDRRNGDFLLPLGGAGKTVASAEEEGFLSGKIFGDRFTDPVKQARYENVMAAMITILVLSLTLVSLAIVMRRRKTQSERKGDLHKKIARFGQKYWGATDSSNSSRHGRTWSLVSTTNISSAAYSEETRDRLECKTKVRWAPTTASGADSVCSLSPSTNELSRSVMSIIQSAELPALPSLSGVSSPRPTEKESVEEPISVSAIDLAYREDNDEEGSADQDVFDLIEKATELLAEESEDDEYFLPGATSGTSSVDSDDEITLDSVWNRDLLSPSPSMISPDQGKSAQDSECYTI